MKNAIIDRFINDVADVLENHNLSLNSNTEDELDVPFIIAPLHDISLTAQTTFINDISDGKYSIRYYKTEASEFGYGNGKVIVFIDDTDTSYDIEFGIEPRPNGYCNCNSEDVGYDTNHKCCGRKCDWNAPSYSLERIELLNNYVSFDGTAADYWEFEKQYKNNRALKNEEFAKKLKEKTKRELELKIESIRESLSILEEEYRIYV